MLILPGVELTKEEEAPYLALKCIVTHAATTAMTQTVHVMALLTREAVMVTTVTVVEPLHGVAHGIFILLIVLTVALRALAYLHVLAGTGLFLAGAGYVVLKDVVEEPLTMESVMLHR